MIRWSDDPNPLFLFTEDEFNQLPDNMELESIGGEKAIKGKDYIDMDTRFGYIAYGVRDPHNHPEKHLLLTFQLKT